MNVMKEQFEINDLKLLDLERVDISKPIDLESILTNNSVEIEPDRLFMNDTFRIFGGKKIPEPFINEELPESFTNRTFIKNLSALSYQLEELPGKIVKYDKKQKNYGFVDVNRFVAENQQPKATIIDDGILYSSIINSEASFNGTLLIAGLKVDHKSIMELLIQDVVMAIVPDQHILKEELKLAVSKYPELEREKFFFIKGATLTIINNKKYKEQKFEASVNNTYVTAAGKVFASNEKFSRERLVSLDLISLAYI
jgi:hypothetical protein